MMWVCSLSCSVFFLYYFRTSTNFSMPLQIRQDILQCGMMPKDIRLIRKKETGNILTSSFFFIRANNVGTSFKIFFSFAHWLISFTFDSLGLVFFKGFFFCKSMGSLHFFLMSPPYLWTPYQRNRQDTDI